MKPQTPRIIAVLAIVALITLLPATGGASTLVGNGIENPLPDAAPSPGLDAKSYEKCETDCPPKVVAVVTTGWTFHNAWGTADATANSYHEAHKGQASLYACSPGYGCESAHDHFIGSTNLHVENRVNQGDCMKAYAYTSADVGGSDNDVEERCHH